MLCTGLFPNADTKIRHRRCPTCPLWYDKYQLCSIWLNYAYFCMWFKYGLKAQKLQKQHALKAQKPQKQHALKGPKAPEAARPEGPKAPEAARPERAEAPSPGHRPGYNDNQQGAL